MHFDAYPSGANCSSQKDAGESCFCHLDKGPGWDDEYLPFPGSLVLAAVVLSSYLVYYRFFVVSKPRVVCADPARLAALETHCPALFEEFWPTVWAPHAFMQTVLRATIGASPRSERERSVL